MRELANNYWSQWAFRVTRKEAEALEQVAAQRVQLALLELAAAEEVLSQLRVRRARWSLNEKGVFVHTRVLVNYDTGPQEAVFEGIEKHLDNSIAVRYLTKKGKPMKRLTWLPYEAVQHIQLKDAPLNPNSLDAKTLPELHKMFQDMEQFSPNSEALRILRRVIERRNLQATG